MILLMAPKLLPARQETAHALLLWEMSVLLLPQVRVVFYARAMLERLNLLMEAQPVRLVIPSIMELGSPTEPSPARLQEILF